MATGQALKNLSTDVVMNIQSYLMGEPITLKMKRNETLKAIQNKYKINYTEPQVWNNLYIKQTQMSYLIIRENIKPHMINNSKNLNRIVSFINQFQYGIPEDYDDDVETEEINLDDDVYDEVDIDDDNPIKVVVELSLLSQDQIQHRDGNIYKFNSHWTTKYTFEKPTKKLVSKVLGMFVEECQRFKQKKEKMIERNELLQFKFTHFEVLAFLKRDDDSDGEDSDDDNSEED